MAKELQFEPVDEVTLIEGMRLTEQEIDVLDRYVDMMKQAYQNPGDFMKSERVAFTPGALLVVAVAKFAYDVYQDYGKAAVTPGEIQMRWKDIAKELVATEARGEDALGLDSYARFRKGLIAAKRSR